MFIMVEVDNLDIKLDGYFRILIIIANVGNFLENWIDSTTIIVDEYYRLPNQLHDSDFCDFFLFFFVFLGHLIRICVEPSKDISNLIIVIRSYIGIFILEAHFKNSLFFSSHSGSTTTSDCGSQEKSCHSAHYGLVATGQPSKGYD